jgi:hypothetical protein
MFNIPIFPKVFRKGYMHLNLISNFGKLVRNVLRFSFKFRFTCNLKGSLLNEKSIFYNNIIIFYKLNYFNGLYFYSK